MKNYTKKLVAFASALIFIIIFASPLFVLRVQATQMLRMRLDGEFLNLSQNYNLPSLNERSVFVPLRAIMEALGYTVEWTENTQTVTIVRTGHISRIQIDADSFMVNGADKQMEIPARLVENRTMVCLDTISAITGLGVRLDNMTHIIDLLTMGYSRSVVTQRPVSSPIQTTVDEFELGLTPKELVMMLNESTGISLPPTREDDQDWESIYNAVDNPVRDGRIYNVGGDFSFFFAAEDVIFNYTAEGLFESIIVQSSRIRTIADAGVGDSRDSVLASHGMAYMESPFLGRGVIEYFDGENYLFFVFRADYVQEWGIGSISIFDIHAHIFS
ncbi:MAG: copper amine oxidase N-terminal domain-containing protein [Defluviitaleaceae bacterium]|nr:copper amine oxidase N-terminal domain-containing protein [Defluviitaleaceae bacterium]